MLVVTRQAGEQIKIGDNIMVTVLSVGPHRVRLGLDAPKYIPIDRQEVAEKMRKITPHEFASKGDYTGICLVCNEYRTHANHPQS